MESAVVDISVSDEDVTKLPTVISEDENEEEDISLKDEDYLKIFAKPERFEDVLDAPDDVVRDDSHHYGEEDFESKKVLSGSCACKYITSK